MSNTITAKNKSIINAYHSRIEGHVSLDDSIFNLQYTTVAPTRESLLKAFEKFNEDESINIELKKELKHAYRYLKIKDDSRYISAMKKFRGYLIEHPELVTSSVQIFLQIIGLTLSVSG